MKKQAWIALLLVGGCATETDAPMASRRGVDYSWDRPSPQGLVAAEYTFAVRYVSFDATGKNLSAGEASALREAGIDLVVNWETNAQDALGGLSAGVRDSPRAIRASSTTARTGRGSARRRVRTSNARTIGGRPTPVRCEQRGVAMLRRGGIDAIVHGGSPDPAPSWGIDEKIRL